MNVIINPNGRRHKALRLLDVCPRTADSMVDEIGPGRSENWRAKLRAGLAEMARAGLVIRDANYVYTITAAGRERLDEIEQDLAPQPNVRIFARPARV